MTHDFKAAVVVGSVDELVDTERGAEAATSVPRSDEPRGLSIRAVTVSEGWSGLWGLLNRRKKIYLLSIAMDLSGDAPVILPPRQVPADAILTVAKGETIHFSLGDGAPLFPVRELVGGLIVYILVAEADKGVRHIGEVLDKIHGDLSTDKTLQDAIVQLVASPAATVTNIALGALTAALQPIATVLKANEDDFIALFQGIFSARGPWDDKLTSQQNGVTIELSELA